MAENPTADPTPDPPEVDKQDPLKLGELRSLIEDVVKKVTGSAEKTEDDAHERAQKGTLNRLDRESSIAEQVQAELAKMNEAEKRKAKEDGLAATVKTLTEKVLERAPVERRRIHKFMGWGEPPE
jgi:hypothetical protein